MTTLQKDVIAPGVYAKGKSVFVVKDTDVQTWDANHTQLSADGYKVPVWFEHPDQGDKKAYPVHSEDTRQIADFKNDTYFAGWAEDLFADSKGVLQVKHSPDTPELASKLKKTGAFVSPQYGPWTDKLNGKKYDSIVSHIALTRKPVRKNQNSRFTVAMSQEESHNSKIHFQDENEDAVQILEECEVLPFTNTVQFSLDDCLTGVTASFEGEQVQFALGGGGDMGGGPGDSGMGAGVGMPSPSGENDPEMQTSLDANQQSPQTPISKLTADLKMSLAAHGLHIDEGSLIASSPKTLAAMQSLLMHTIMKSDGVPNEGDENSDHGSNHNETLTAENLLKQQGSGHVQSEPVIVTMSETSKTVTATETIANPAEDSFAALKLVQDELKTAQAQLSRQQEVLTGKAREELRTKLNSLCDSGRCDVTWRDGKLEQVDTHQMSDTDEVSDLELLITDRELLPEGAVWSDDQKIIQLSKDDEVVATSVLSPGFRNTEEPSDEDVDAYIKTLDIHGGRLYG